MICSARIARPSASFPARFPARRLRRPRVIRLSRVVREIFGIAARENGDDEKPIYTTREIGRAFPNRRPTARNIITDHFATEFAYIATERPSPFLETP